MSKVSRPPFQASSIGLQLYFNTVPAHLSISKANSMFGFKIWHIGGGGGTVFTQTWGITQMRMVLWIEMKYGIIMYCLILFYYYVMSYLVQ